MKTKTKYGCLSHKLAIFMLAMTFVVVATVSSFADVTIGKEWNDGLTGTSANNRALPTVTLTGETSYEKLLNLFYPVGCYFETTDGSFDPNTAWGGTWEKVPSGRFIQATTGSDAGETVAAGLPNITGGYTPSAHYGNGVYLIATSMTGPSGAIYTTSASGTVGYPAFGTVLNNSMANKVNFDASRSNSIYGNSSTVQPPAIKAYIWHRTS